MTREALVWALAAVYAGTQIAQPLSGNAIPSSAFNAAITLSSFTAALVHGSIRYGWRGIGVFAVLMIVISNGLENLSIVTGFPFGWYHYSPALGPQIFHVPLVIGPAYFSVGYVAWAVANTILEGADQNRHRFDWLMLPTLAAFVMVGWDVAMDPLRSTVAGYWIWPNGGGYFGVPLSNFLGWYFTVFVVYLLFTSILVRRPTWIREGQGAAYWSQAAILLLACILPFLLLYAAGSDQTVQDARGVAWRVADVQESAVLVGLFTIVFASMAAIFSIARRSAK
ncbi:putative membrane protein [Bradyrhizobium japonicum]|uniref:carotenoid biosynthesis protein n=1 Tax=Bradyrhizobium japonicum TaxID=375 RepID=UPI002169B55E|nr:carotenoid biosynthesis protein [Bradyrhizobium japonicum]MCS3502248.1 putative membrane protein [Bradyrhizobium japonicum]MCS3965038.1 putative membrane protein [Bradyrhizobium japonicum]MCS3997345.1 putative membrane protein [Bradyrhizobium japonicum]